MLRVIELGPAEKGKELVFRYETEYYYDVELQERDGGWRLELTRRPFGAAVQKEFRDVLLGDWLEEPSLYGAELDGRIVGYLELSHETWNNRLRISNIWVAGDCRRQGIGSALMDAAAAEACRRGARSLVLETQSCNDPAIQFYRRHGFSLVGLDLTAYSETDRKKKEVRLELARPVTRAE